MILLGLYVLVGLGTGAFIGRWYRRSDSARTKFAPDEVATSIVLIGLLWPFAWLFWLGMIVRLALEDWLS